MYQYTSTTKDAYNKAFPMKAPKVNADKLQPGGSLARQLNNEKPHWKKPVTGSGVAFQLCQ